MCYRGAIIRLEAEWRHRLACAGEAACRPAVECYRWQTTTDDRKQNNTAPYTMCKRASNKDVQKRYVLRDHVKWRLLPNMDSATISISVAIHRTIYGDAKIQLLVVMSKKVPDISQRSTATSLKHYGIFIVDPVTYLLLSAAGAEFF